MKGTASLKRMRHHSVLFGMYNRIFGPYLKAVERAAGQHVCPGAGCRQTDRHARMHMHMHMAGREG
jgi:hypothetical protein